jgi:predicted nucleic acid-binding protein
MRFVFADTCYWIALANPRDQHAGAAQALENELKNAILVTTEEVLGEFLTGMSNGGPHTREIASEMVDQIIANPNIQVEAQTRESFNAGRRRYRERNDKTYSFADCVSMVTMERMMNTSARNNTRSFFESPFHNAFRRFRRLLMASLLICDPARQRSR